MRESAPVWSFAILSVGVLIGFGVIGAYLLFSGSVWYGLLFLIISGVVAAIAAFGPTKRLQAVAKLLRILSW